MSLWSTTCGAAAKTAQTSSCESVSFLATPRAGASADCFLRSLCSQSASYATCLPTCKRGVTAACCLLSQSACHGAGRRAVCGQRPERRHAVSTLVGCTPVSGACVVWLICVGACAWFFCLLGDELSSSFNRMCATTTITHTHAPTYTPRTLAGCVGASSRCRCRRAASWGTQAALARRTTSGTCCSQRTWLRHSRT